MNTIIVWGIPTCSTVKKARTALDDAGIGHRFRDLRAEPPTDADVVRFVAALGNKALRNTAGGSYRALADGKDGWTDAEWIKAFVGDPMLLKRPIIERDGRTIAAGFKDDTAILAALRL